MTRIVAGTARGRRLRVPPAGTRPTSDRVREALFSAVGARIGLDGARVLDLYAGSGALGLEALSRGAAHALLVESNRRAATVLRGNVADLGLPGAQVMLASVGAVLAAGPAEPYGPYDIVFADPPYALAAESVATDLAALIAHGWLRSGCLVAVERATRSEPIDWPPGFDVEAPRSYGETRIELASYGGSGTD
ncbi:MAG TPA: 16S rRNA (guanine(966)-N(2))-methyltransferase RsmD [Aldersonia sp.]